MSRHNFFYFAREGAYNMFNHGFMSFAAIGVTAVSYTHLDVYKRQR